MDVYFVDSSLVPLMVQHSYVSAMPQLSPSEMSRPESEREVGARSVASLSSVAVTLLYS